MSEKTKKEFKPLGLPWWLCAGVVAIGIIGAYTGALGSDLGGTFLFMLSLGLVFGEIGDRIPIWNTYIGGGLVLAFLGSAFLATYNYIPANTLDSIKLIMDEADFLTFFIIFLICGSILSLERGLLLRSFAGYLPAIFGGLIGAGILGIIVGLVFGIDPATIIIKYVLPIMGGGNGAGAVPLSEIYETVTGLPAADYYSFAITILTIANIFAIITAAILKRVGEIKPALTGDGNQLIRKGADFATDDKKVSASMKEIGGAFFLAVGFYGLARLFSKVLLPEIFGVAIHTFAYMIIFVAIAAGMGVVPESIRAGAKKLQSFFTGNLILIVMVGVGVDTNIIELMEAINPANVCIAFAIVVGAIFGSGFVGYLVGFFPVDSAITAGLCMANRGGSGDLAVLGAANRMGLIAYAQLSSRLGGGIVLIVGSILFGAML